MAQKAKPNQKRNQIKSSRRLGILGGGQLARMLALRAHPMGIQPWVLSLNESDPAAQVTRFWVQGDPADPECLRPFLKSIDLATFESEFLDAALLARLQKQTKVEVFPQPHLMAKLQDRLTQKEWLVSHQVATAPYLPVSSQEELKQALKLFGTPVVLKQRKMGYDGYGTFILKSPTDLKKLSERIETNSHGFVAEPFIKFRRELALLVVRSRSGAICQLPLVETFQKNSCCLWVKGPIGRAPGFSAFAKRLTKAVDDSDYVGVMAFELFETSKGKFLVNEIAPRVHNSGHYTMDALATSQFEYHIRALFGLALPVPTLRCNGFAMWNLLGQGQTQSPQLYLDESTHMHYYGKSQVRPGRKMGHINVLDRSPDRAWKKAKSLAAKSAL